MNMILALFVGLIPMSLTGAGTGLASETLHFALSRSVPEADAEVASPSEVRLSFTEVPQDGTTSIRLLDSEQHPVQTGAVQQDPDDNQVFSISLPQDLAIGIYTVAWRAMGSDGHVVRNTFSFTIIGAQESP